ncbi:protein of unknown function [Maridesulfovibrio hydrothermalis AM13 = DSM 14728]|uniref:Uncharacterized protein n=1 Tax=Maridesulfovibrio hydrothermalis AM13 = DSM 14728 TaxID=1121451 RepID=L0R7H3_9BACT|nr:protein of unknown function [Maridesulfovibrio hydrothermalis AM13 = DSM 14728]
MLHPESVFCVAIKVKPSKHYLHLNSPAANFEKYTFIIPAHNIQLSAPSNDS